MILNVHTPEFNSVTNCIIFECIGTDWYLLDLEHQITDTSLH